MTPRTDYLEAMEKFREKVSEGPVAATIDMTVTCLAETRSALCVAGLGDQELIRDLISVQYRLADLINPPEASEGNSHQGEPRSAP